MAYVIVGSISVFQHRPVRRAIIQKKDRREANLSHSIPVNTQKLYIFTSKIHFFYSSVKCNTIPHIQSEETTGTSIAKHSRIGFHLQCPEHIEQAILNWIFIFYIYLDSVPCNLPLQLNTDRLDTFQMAPFSLWALVKSSAL